MRFILISPALPFPDGSWSYAAGSPRYAWTASAIDGARAASIPWVVVGMHKPCISIGQYSCDPGADLLNLLVDKRVDLVLSGHEHLYQRTHQLKTGLGCTAIVPGTYTAACVADADANMVKGVGTVFATVGTGGVALRDIDPADTEAPFVAAASGLNANPTWGSLDVSATATSLTAGFARATGGTFADSFTLGPPTTATNLPPLASFTSTCTLLTCDVTGAASSDPDGTIEAWAWDFGDGTTATGVSASHSYAAAGTYTARLTVTDDDGDTGITTRTITVTASTGSLATDGFDRTVANGWGSAPVGGPWTISGLASRFAVNGTAGLIQLPTGSGGIANLTGVSSTSADVKVVLTTDKPAAGGSIYVSVAGRRVATAGAYQAKAVIAPTGRVTLALVRVNASGGAETVLQSAAIASGTTYVPGMRLALRLQVTGTDPTLIRARVWVEGAAEPTTWLRSFSDATAGLQTAGGLGVTGYLSSSATNAPVSLIVDDLLAVTP